MSSRDRTSEPGRVQLNEEDVAYVMNLLRNATQPVNTQQLIDVLRRHRVSFRLPLGSVRTRQVSRRASHAHANFEPGRANTSSEAPVPTQRRNVMISSLGRAHNGRATR